jgi:hypothetical protein
LDARDCIVQSISRRILKTTQIEQNHIGRGAEAKSKLWEFYRKNGSLDSHRGYRRELAGTAGAMLA